MSANGSGAGSLRPGELRLEDRPEGDWHQILLSGELDIASAPTLETTIWRLCADGAAKIVLDLGGLAFIDSSGLRTIIHIQDVCEKQSCEFSLLPGAPAVQRLFVMTGLTERLSFVDTAG